MSVRRKWAVVVHWDNGAEEVSSFWTRASAERDLWWWRMRLCQIYGTFPPDVTIERSEERS